MLLRKSLSLSRFAWDEREKEQRKRTLPWAGWLYSYCMSKASYSPPLYYHVTECLGTWPPRSLGLKPLSSLKIFAEALVWCSWGSGSQKKCISCIKDDHVSILKAEGHTSLYFATRRNSHVFTVVPLASVASSSSCLDNITPRGSAQKAVFRIGKEWGTSTLRRECWGLVLFQTDWLFKTDWIFPDLTNLSFFLLCGTPEGLRSSRAVYRALFMFSAGTGRVWGKSKWPWSNLLRQAPLFSPLLRWIASILHWDISSYQEYGRPALSRLCLTSLGASLRLLFHLTIFCPSQVVES